MDDLILGKSDNPYLDYVLCYGDIIAHVLVVDTVGWVNNTESELSVGKYGATVKCEIIEPIKGKIIPEINGSRLIHRTGKFPAIQGVTVAVSSKTLYFDYCFGWPRKSDSGKFLNMRDSTGGAWLKNLRNLSFF